MKTETQYITPELAKKMLGKMVLNRSVSHHRVHQYAADMRNGKWMLSPHGIVFDAEGKLIDGQHRLLAIIEFGSTVPMNVTTGTSPDLFRVIDTGQARSRGQIAHIGGVPNANAVTSIVNHVHLIRHSVGRECVGPNGAAPLSMSDFLDMIRSDDRYVYSSRIAGNAQKMCKALTHTPMGAVHYLASLNHPREADSFVRGIGDGDGLRRGDPRFAVRERMIARASSQKKESIYVIDWWFIAAWNAYIDGREMKIIRISEGMTVPEVR